MSEQIIAAELHRDDDGTVVGVTFNGVVFFPGRDLPHWAAHNPTDESLYQFMDAMTAKCQRGQLSSTRDVVAQTVVDTKLWLDGDIKLEDFEP